jgi:nucleotide-binding universal stress UspA family protein
VASYISEVTASNSRGDDSVSIFPTRILVATDGSREAALAVTTAADLAKSTDSELHLVHVGEMPLVYHPERHAYRAQYEEHEREAQQWLEAQLERIEGADATLLAQAHLRMGRADEEIVELAHSIEAGLIVMGSRGQGRLRRALLGSVSESVIRHAHCPVTIVRE